MNHRTAARARDAAIARRSARTIGAPNSTPIDTEARAASLAYGCVDWFLYGEAETHEASSAETDSIASALRH